MHAIQYLAWCGSEFAFAITSLEETLEEDTLQDHTPCTETPEDEHPAQEEQEAWNLEDVELELLDSNCVAKPHCNKEGELKPEVPSAQGNCQHDPLVPSSAQGPVIDAEERALLNLLKFDNRGPRGSRWNGPGCPRRFVSLVDWPKRGEDEKERRKDRFKKRTRLERNSSMLERLQSCLNRAEAQKKTVASLDTVEAVEGE